MITQEKIAEFCRHYRSILRSSSLHHLANSQPIEEKREEEENISSSLPKLNQVANMSRAQSLIGIKEKVKSARYRPPGFNQAPNIIKQIDDKMSMSTPALHQDTHPRGSESLMNVSKPFHRLYVQICVMLRKNAKYKHFLQLRSSTDSFSSIFENSVGRINIRGQIEFGLQYNYKLASLEVRVNQCKDLAAVDTKRNRSDPYVIFRLFLSRVEFSQILRTNQTSIILFLQIRKGLSSSR